MGDKGSSAPSTPTYVTTSSNSGMGMEELAPLMMMMLQSQQAMLAAASQVPDYINPPTPTPYTPIDWTDTFNQKSSQAVVDLANYFANRKPQGSTATSPLLEDEEAITTESLLAPANRPKKD